MASVANFDQPRQFEFIGYRFDPEAGELQLEYRFDDGPCLRERLNFPGAPYRLPTERWKALDGLFRLLHRIAGISYYKAWCPPKLVDLPLSDGVASFLNTLYEQGLGEFAYQNELDLSGRVHFPTGGRAMPAVAVDLPRRSLVAIGGGKDSLVSVESLRETGEIPVLFSMGSAPLIDEVAQATGLEHLRVRRQLAPELFEMNQAGAMNGHVPVTAIVMLVGLCCAVLHGFDRLVMSNERSADVGNLTLASGQEANHQYSKGFAFELSLSELLAAEVVRGLTCFSLLRPLSEAAIAARFAHLTQYHRVFSSCNRNFHLRPEARLGEALEPGATDNPRPWCRNCPKCRFVFLALAPFVEREQLISLFGGNLLADPEQRQGYAELLGLSGHKPFECVGEIEESQALLRAVAARPEWQQDALVQGFAEVVSDAPRLSDVLEPRGEHQVPVELLTAIDVTP